MRRQSNSTRGVALLTTTILITMILAFVLAGLTLVAAKATEATIARTSLQARSTAEAGVEHGIYWLREVMKIWGNLDVFNLLDPDQTNDILTGSTQVIFANAQNGEIPGRLADAGNNVVGEYDVFIDVRDRGAAEHRIVVLRARGYVPTKAAVFAGLRHAAVLDVYARIRVSQADGQAGNYAYFINHWGWFSGANIDANGSCRANGLFGLVGNPTVNGSPIYGDAQGSDLIDPLNGGGLFAGLDIYGTCNGMGGLADNQYERQDPVVMPNLSDLGWYRQNAITTGSSVTVGGTELSGNGVYGDEAGEKQHLYLHGTPDDPIRITGTVVVEGSVIISGVVAGQGSIVAGDSIYIADDVEYANALTSNRPAATDEASVEAWIAQNLNKDFLGLYSREHIIIGDHTNATWQNSVYGWLLHNFNRSDEDCGLDRIHLTTDQTEDDGNWEIERYTDEHAALGLLPVGSRVGDIIPASGEDLDGDGVNDPAIPDHAGWRAEFEIPAELSSVNWGGNLPVENDLETIAFSDISSGDISTLDGCLFTNHAIAGYFRDPAAVNFNGAVISRNESMVVFSPDINLNHDERLTGRSWEDLGIVGGGGRVWEAITVEAWWTPPNG